MEKAKSAFVYLVTLTSQKELKYRIVEIGRAAHVYGLLQAAAFFCGSHYWGVRASMGVLGKAKAKLTRAAAMMSVNCILKV